jgi:hypothetical protein
MKSFSITYNEETDLLTLDRPDEEKVRTEEISELATASYNSEDRPVYIQVRVKPFVALLMGVAEGFFNREEEI